jgi:hypothetical protein
MRNICQKCKRTQYWDNSVIIFYRLYFNIAGNIAGKIMHCKMWNKLKNSLTGMLGKDKLNMILKETIYSEESIQGFRGDVVRGKCMH